MSSELEKSHDTNDGKEFKNVCVVQIGGQPLQREIKIEGKRGRKVNYVHRSEYELKFGGSAQKSNRDFDRKPGIANAFNVEEELVRIGLQLGQFPSFLVGSVLFD